MAGELEVELLCDLSTGHFIVYISRNDLNSELDF